jgi:hypothetical protein
MPAVVRGRAGSFGPLEEGGIAPVEVAAAHGISPAAATDLSVAENLSRAPSRDCVERPECSDSMVPVACMGVANSAPGAPPTAVAGLSVTP